MEAGGLMADRVLRDHSEPCGHEMAWIPGMLRSTLLSDLWQCGEDGCPGGREVTDAEITEMAYSIWQAEQMDEYHLPYGKQNKWTNTTGKFSDD